MGTGSRRSVKYLITGELCYDHADDERLPHLLHVRLLSICALFGLELEEVKEEENED